MIVIASHDRVDLLKNLLNQLSVLDLNGHDVLIVDTNSTNEEYRIFFDESKIKYSHFKFDRKDYPCWDTGAYIHAYKNYPAERYIFLQDSIEITNPKLFLMWDAFLNVYDVVPFINFKYWYENNEQRIFVEKDLPVNEKPNDAIFGPIFGVNKSILDKIPNEWFIEPKNKMEGCGMERRWSYMFHLINASKHYIEYENISKGHTIYSSKSNIHKIFLHRLD
jgi:hypothetical protein